MERIDHLLPWSSLGSERRLSVFRYGKGPRKVYIQSSLHADELPGMRTAWELKQRLADLESRGQLNCVVELVPPRTLPRTSSGKLSRAKARTLYLSGEIQPYDIAA